MIRDLEQITKSLGGDQSPIWFNDLRTQGLSRFNELGIPTVKDEEWKYTNLVSLGKCTFRVAKENGLVEHEALENYCDRSETNIVFVNGIFSQELSNMDNIPDGINISMLLLSG